MLKRLAKLNNFVRGLRSGVEYDIEPYKKILEGINNTNLTALTDSGLKKMSADLKSRPNEGVLADTLLVEAFALVREVSARTLGMRSFDVQVMVGIALHLGKIAEMQTGEGKTLAAVMPAYLNALTGKGVHILTFNDYLAQRDAEWMGPIYRFLGLTVGCVKEGMGQNEKRRAYACDITYVTAKEAGFDYLRDFLCFEKEKLIHRPFHYAIVDEADSILIDEARVPLVIAGAVTDDAADFVHLSEIVNGLIEGKDYEIDQPGMNAYFTDEGLFRIEEILGCGSLYDQDNLELLTALNCALFARVLLKRDRDYIVRNNKIELVDEFTGRVADNRHWPDNLQEAVEAKEGLTGNSKGRVMGSITMQHFMNLYPNISGMTGTACSAAAEFQEFYGMNVGVIPTNKPCIRRDYPIQIFSHKEAKLEALIEYIADVNSSGRPILIGTDSIMESEQLAAALERKGVDCQVLNAKNDEIEAEVIANAGGLGAVTVSTNMAGRGVDIKLGGQNEQERDKVVSLGGLLVIGTSLHESRRVTDQLRGRAGRQGDPGETRFFISLEDEIVQRYDLTKLIPKRNFPHKRSGPITDIVVARELIRGQRIVEGYNSDLRRQLLKYSLLIEQQRRIIHRKRQDILTDKVVLGLLATNMGQVFRSLCSKFGEDVLIRVEKKLTLYQINKNWADYLANMAYEREGIHLVVIGRKNPLDEFHRIAIMAFDEMLDRIDSDIIQTFKDVEITENGIDLDKEGLKMPSSTWTYLINEDQNQFSNLQNAIKAASTFINRPLFTVQDMYSRVFRKLVNK